jgi:hypothetical protein
MNLTGMVCYSIFVSTKNIFLFHQNVGNQVHGILCDIVHLLCQIDRTFAVSNVIDHPIVPNCIRIIQTSINSICSTGV